jgi:hypothetical protein
MSDKAVELLQQIAKELAELNQGVAMLLQHDDASVVDNLDSISEKLDDIRQHLSPKGGVQRQLKSLQESVDCLPEAIAAFQ